MSNNKREEKMLWNERVDRPSAINNISLEDLTVFREALVQSYKCDDKHIRYELRPIFEPDIPDNAPNDYIHNPAHVIQIVDVVEVVYLMQTFDENNTASTWKEIYSARRPLEYHNVQKLKLELNKRGKKFREVMGFQGRRSNIDERATGNYGENTKSKYIRKSERGFWNNQKVKK